MINNAGLQKNIFFYDLYYLTIKLHETYILPVFRGINNNKIILIKTRLIY